MYRGVSGNFKRAEIVLKHKKWPENTSWGYFNNKTRAEISFKAELSHP